MKGTVDGVYTKIVQLGLNSKSPALPLSTSSLELSSFAPHIWSNIYHVNRSKGKQWRILTWSGYGGHLEQVQSASRPHVLCDNLKHKIILCDPSYTSHMHTHTHTPCSSIVFCPLGALRANWSKVRISPPALRILARAVSVNLRAQIFTKGKVMVKVMVTVKSPKLLSTLGFPVPERHWSLFPQQQLFYLNGPLVSFDASYREGGEYYTQLHFLFELTILAMERGGRFVLLM